MASTTALFTGLSGILVHSRMLDVVGNNIANTNTTAYKSNRIQFENNISRNFGLGTAPGENTGGSNPTQVGLGVQIAGTQRDFNNGALSATGVRTDMAIEGEGFFVVDFGGERQYTRDGSFSLSSENKLVSIGGGVVKGYAVNEDFEVIPGALVDMTIPVGSMTLAEATRNVRFTGNLNSSGAEGVNGSQSDFAALTVLTGVVSNNPPFADATTLLTDLDDGSGSAMFAVGESIRVSGAEKGGRTLDDAEYAVTAASTVTDFMNFLEEALGIDTSVSGNPGGVSIDDTTGVVTVEGNYGVDNSIELDSSDLAILDTNGIAAGQPFVITNTQLSDGESVRTTFVVYDSLGTPLNVDLTLVLDTKDDTGTTWRYFAESADSVGVDLRLGTGTVSFDTTGTIIAPAEFNVSIDRTDSGAVNPLNFSVNFSDGGESVTALTDSRSELAATHQDGSPIGSLSDFGVGEDGIITGSFTNGLLRTIGQLAVATFTNPEGLVDEGSNMFRSGASSGEAIVTTPLTLGAGRVVGGALELSNVDLSQEFVNLILAQTGYSASSRVISTANELIQQLLILGR
ncbi:MAG: flagellar hook protein FlgE [Phycisphaerales bacterium]